MKGLENQIWVTTAISDQDVGRALTLCLSIKRVMSSRKVGVIVSSRVAASLRKVLTNTFDHFFLLDEGWNNDKLPIEKFAKIFCLVLKSFKKCVFLSTNMLVVKNCDEIFNECDEISTFPCARFSFDEPIFLINPSLLAFGDVMENIKSGNEFKGGFTPNIAREAYFKQQTLVAGKYKHCISAKTPDILLGKHDNISIVELQDVQNLQENFENIGLIEKRVLQYYNGLYENEVLPILKSAEQKGPTFYKDIASYTAETPNEPVAIVGMSCRLPGANNLQEFWNILFGGVDATTTPPDYRWLKEHCTKRGNEFHTTNAGFLKTRVDEFDAKFFGISPMEMNCMDPQHRILLELVWEGLENAAINPQCLQGSKSGVFVGSWMDDFKDILINGGGPINNDMYRKYMGNSIGAAAARISHFLGLTGPSIATESGCSSAMVAVHLACQSLQRRESSFALACGVNLILQPFVPTEMPMVFSPDGYSKTFDEKANGYARAEGAGVLVLKRLSDAVNDGDHIWALIRGSAVAQEGMSKSMGTPTIQCESMVMKSALEDADVDPSLVSYVETHGTGTAVGDPLEVAAISKAYHSPTRKDPLIIGSVKTNVGHTESCSGITGILKVVLAMHHEIIPPHRNFETLNPAIDLNAIPAIIPLSPKKWSRTEGIQRFAGVSSFGITGTDTHVIIEESPELDSSNNVLCNSEMERQLHLMKITAKTEEALNILLEKYSVYFNVDVTPKESFKDIACTSNIGRADFSQRAVVIAKTTNDALTAIKSGKFIRGEENLESIGKICFLFTGQGSQYPGMAKNLYETSPVFRIHFQFCQNILKNGYNIDVAQVLWSQNTKGNEINRTIYSQTSIFCVEYSLLKLWESWEVKPDYVIGHSLGEFAAAVCAGLLTVEDAIKLVAERSKLIDALPPGKMLVIKGDQKCVDTLLNSFPAMDKNKVLDYAAINSNDQTVVAGDSEYILKFSEHCKNSNVKCTVLESTHAFHSKHMDPMLESYRSVAKTLKQMKGNKNCKYVSGMRGSCLEEGSLEADYWVEHTREKVSFLDASKLAVKLGCKTFIEIGPQPVLSALTMMNNDDVQLTCLPSLRKKENEWETLLNTVGKLYVKGLAIDWKGFEAFYERKVVSNLPTYPFIRKTFWPDLSSVAGQLIHPLIGSTIPNASSAKLFQCGMNLRNIDYVKDHVVGNNIIFPGAGYLEMCLAAGIATMEGSTESLPRPTRPMIVENLFIEAPLLLNESKTCHLQTVTELNLSSNNSDEKDWNGINIKICRQLESDSSKWFPHARATFSPLVSSHDKQVEFDVKNFQENLCNLSPDFSTQVYARLASVGLKFGPTFRSIEATWRNEDKQMLITKVKIPAQDQSQTPGNYVIHPVILDAMIQSIMMLSLNDKKNKTLYLPIKIGKFVWLSDPNPESSQLYIQSFNTNSKQQISSATTSILVDEGGKVLAIMSNVELIQTTLNTFESVLQQQTNVFPEFLEEVWKKSKSPLQYTTDMEGGSQRKMFTEEFCRAFEDEFNNPSHYVTETFRNLEQLVYLNFLRSLIKLGWKPELYEDGFCEENLFCSLGIKTEFRKYFGFMLQVLEGEGILEKQADDMEKNWKVIQNPPSYQDILNQLTSPHLTSDLVEEFMPTLLFQKMGESLESILTGSVSAVSLLFPESGTSLPSIADFYHHYKKKFQISELSIPANLLLKSVCELQTNPEFELRILEVGAGTGAQTEKLLDLLETNAIRFEYTYTDISSSFFVQAQETFKKNLSSIKFKKLDIEEDPLQQGFTPEYFDFIFAAEVIHATKNISESLRNVRMLMKPFGKLCIIESTKVNRINTFLVGPLEGYWRFQDSELRQNHCILEKDKWAQVLQSNGFQVDGMLSVFNDKHSCIVSHKTQQQLSYSTQPCKKIWLVFHLQNHPISDQLLKKFQHLEGRKVITVTAEDIFENDAASNSFVLRKTEYEDFAAMLELVFSEQKDVEGIIYCWVLNKNVSTQEEVLQPYFNLTKALLTLDLKRLPRLALITTGVVPLEDNDLSSFHVSTLLGYSKSMKNENIHFNCKSIEIADERQDESRVQEIFYEIWSSTKENQIAFSGNSRYILKHSPHKPVSSALQIPSGTDRFHLIMPETKSISDLQFGPMDLMEMKRDEVEVQIKASALNFRDVLSVLKPTAQFENVNAIGFDFSGVVKRVGREVTKWQIGDRVSGCNMENQAFPSHAIVNQDLLLPLPTNVTFCEAATIPAVYVTSIVSLIETAKIRKDDIVLIHTATGGVGLSAIEICKHVGCTIVATAGSKRKQNYLRSLGIQHIFHSRDTRYADLILELTNGHGVDVVLNSLTSEGFKEATLRACATGARFVEMSKLNIWKPEEVKELRPDVNYTVVDVASADNSEWKRYMGVVQNLIGKQVVKPIPYVRFDGQNVREALQFMQKAKHVGKIVCVMPEMRNDDGEVKIHTLMFSDNATYLITGGLGGIGFVVCKWMVENGAKHVILASRGPPTDPVREIINGINKERANIIPVQLDVGDFKQCEDLLHNQLPTLNIPSLKGIMHAAGTLADGLIINQTWDTLSSTFKAKINGTLNLHELTKHLNLEHFVLFSSVVATFGLPGQSNHAAANAFEDAFAHYRQSIGLPATTINWGQWGEVGIAKEMELAGMKALSTAQCMAGLEYVLKTQRIQTSILNVDSYLLLKIVPQLAVNLDERVWNSSVSRSTLATKFEAFWPEFDKLTETVEKVNLVTKRLKVILRNTLKMDESEVVDDNANLLDLGVDSLMFVEIKNSIQSLLEDRCLVNAGVVKDSTSVAHLSESLVKLIGEEGENKVVV